jgi:hypothetical protein
MSHHPVSALFSMMRVPQVLLALVVLGMAYRRLRRQQRLEQYRALSKEHAFNGPVVEASARGSASGVVDGRAVELGWVENGILRISRERSGAMKVVVVLEVEGRLLPRAALRAALRALQRRHPVLRSRLREDGTGGYLLQEDLSAELQVQWLPLGADRGAAWKQAWAREARAKPPVGQLTVKFLALEDAAAKATQLLFIMDHYFCDGLSVTNMFSELLRLVEAAERAPRAAGAGADADPLALDDALVGPPLGWQLPMEVLVDRSYPNALVKWAKVVHYIVRYLVLEPKLLQMARPDWSVPASDVFNKCTCMPHQLTVPKTELKLLLDECKRQGVTMGVAIAAAVAYTARDLTADRAGVDTEYIAVPLALDLRRRYAEAVDQHHLGYHVSSNRNYRWGVKEARQEGPASFANMWARAKLMGKHYEEFDFAGLRLGVVIGGFFEQPPTYERMATVAISNWGRLDFPEQVGPFKVNKLFGLLNNPHFIMPTLIVSSLHGALTLTIVTTEPACSPELGPAFLNTLKGHLARMAKP